MYHHQLRYLVIFFAVLVTVQCVPAELSEEGKKMMETIHTTCVEQTGVDEALIEKFNTEGTTEEKTMKCYMKCFMTEGTMMDDKGAFNFEPLTQIYSKEHYEASKDNLDSCIEKAEADTDLCDKAYTMSTCYRALEPDFKVM